MEPTKHDINVFIHGLTMNNLTAAQIYRYIQTAWGNIISERRVREIAQEFANGDRTSYERTRGSGRQKTQKRLDLIDQVDEAITEDPHLSSRTLARMFDSSPSMIYRILTEELEVLPVCDRYVPHNLTDVHKENRVLCCREILRAFRTRNIRHRLIHVDEKWIYLRPLGSPSSRIAWVGPYGDLPTIGKRLTTEKKFLILVALNFDGLSYCKVLENGETIDSVQYIAFLREVYDSFNTYELQQNGRHISWENSLLYHDNARPHVSHMTTAFLDDKNCIRLRQPPYSPDTNILDRFVFPKLEMERHKIQMMSTEDVRAFLHEALQRNTADIMERQFEKLKSHCQTIIDHDGSYIL